MLLLLVKRLQNQNLQRRKLILNHLPRRSLLNLLKEKRITTVAKGDKPAKEKQSVTNSKGLKLLSKVSLTEAEQIKLATKRNLIQTHSSHASGSGADEGTGSIPGVPNVPTYKSNDEQISWKSSEEEDDEVNVSRDNDDDVDKDDEDDDADNQDDEIPDDANQDDDDEQTDSDNDGDDFVHPKLSTHDDEARQDDEVNEEESDEESDDESNEDSDEEVQGANIEEEEMDEEATHEEDEANELYRDVNINLEGRDTVMTDAPLPNVQGTQVTEDTHVIITALINPEGQQQSSSVSSGFVSNMLNPSPDTGIDTIFTPNTEATSLVDVLVTTIVEPPLLSATTLYPHLSSHICNKHQLKNLEIDFSEFKQMNQFAEAVSSIPGIVDAYLANKMHEAVKTVDQVKEQVKAQFSKILPKIKKTVNEQLKAKVMTHSSTKSKTSLAIAANLSELELKEILIDKMESNKCRDDEDKDKEPSLGSNRGSKRRRAGKEPESTSAPKEKTSKTSGKSYEGESARDVYSKRRIIAVTKLEIVDWHNYKHLDWITIRRDDDKLYKFKEDNFNRLHIQDIEDMLLLLVQGKLTNLTVEERLAFNNKDKKNRLMCIDELHKFSDGTLNDVRTALNDSLKGIQMEYLLQTIWRQSDKDKAGAMIQAIDKQLKTWRIIQSLEKFAISHNVNNEKYIKSPTHYPYDFARTSE
ncbi:hypothetical protein Tco_0213996 [Tanacetum coccineum]